MLDALKALFARHSAASATSAETAGPAADEQRGLKIAACALLLEMAHADDEFTPAEQKHIEEIVGRHFALDAEATREILEAADRERRDATDLHQLTSVITRHYDEGQRIVLSEILWRVVYADGELSQHEDYLARKLANLLDVGPGYLAEARNRARR